MRDVRQDSLFIGREQELSQVVRNLGRGKHTLILGARGVGKTRLIQEAIAVMRGRARHITLSPGLIDGLAPAAKPDAGETVILTVTRSSPLSECLKELARELHGAGKLCIESTDPVSGPWIEAKRQLVGLGAVRIHESVLASFRAIRPPVILCFDTLDRITVAYQQLLEDLLNSTVVCAAVVTPKRGIPFRKIWSSFNRIHLEPLDNRAATRLVRHCLEVAGTRTVDPEHYVREVLKSANGNPFQIKNMLWMGSREGHVTTDGIRDLRRTEEGEMFNMGPIYIMCSSFLTLFKIFSFGTDNREFYIYFSALGFLVYLVFRVFRTFFLFKPQRR